MVDFRRWIIAAAVLALFAGLASAQVPGGSGQGSLACSASVAVPPQLRSEGLTELIGDIVLLARPLKAHLVATRPGHAINAELTKAVDTVRSDVETGTSLSGALARHPKIFSKLFVHGLCTSLL